MSTAETVVRQQPSWMEDLVPSLGLWKIQGAGHTLPVSKLVTVHSGVKTATRLMRAAQLNLLDELPVAQILKSLAGLQNADGSHLHGCFRWYLEEPAPVDTNASFFIGLNLILLSAGYSDRLDATSREVLNGMLRELRVWFGRECGADLAYYPNKYLGDLVCAWLLHEQLETSGSPSDLADTMDRAADYWLKQHWGWGEHMSDVYSAVMLNELSALLLFSSRLPVPLRRKYLQMFHTLLEIEDMFGGGPRVPAIRTYAFGGRPSPKPFRASVVSWDGRPELAEGGGHVEHFNFGHLFHAHGWTKLAGAGCEVRENIEIACHDGAMARAWVTDHVRLGSLSKFPIMRNTEHAKWGLSWQTMPVVFAAGDDGWGFLRWHTHENDVHRFHPARSKASAYLSNALTDSVSPPVVGLTDALQSGPDVCVLRRMPAHPLAWEYLSDQLVLQGKAFEVVREEVGSEVSKLLLSVDGVPVTFVFFSLGYGVRPSFWREEGEGIWEIAWPPEKLHSMERAAGLWMIFWGRDVACPAPPVPVASPGHPRLTGDVVWTLDWPLVGGIETLLIDPLAATPLQGIGAR